MTPEKNPLLEKAVNLLSYRAHSRKELSDKLKHKTGCKEAELEEISRKNSKSGGVTISCGMAKYDGSGSVASVFERADALCHKR